MKSYETLTKLYNQKDVVELLGHLKNDVDALRSILRRLNKLRKAKLPIHNWFDTWILRNANDIQTHAAMLYEQIEGTTNTETTDEDPAEDADHMRDFIDSANDGTERIVT